MSLHRKGREISQMRLISLNVPLSHCESLERNAVFHSLLSVLLDSVDSDDYFMWIIRIPISCYTWFKAHLSSPARIHHY